ncbi:hypothetical protein HDU96_007187 [Phlyctochytrium bullatum]|nr:hypothetical protein HDU96_007187 [Phlyctochytrium bullatum]
MLPVTTAATATTTTITGNAIPSSTTYINSPNMSAVLTPPAPQADYTSNPGSPNHRVWSSAEQCGMSLVPTSLLLQLHAQAAQAQQASKPMGPFVGAPAPVTTAAPWMISPPDVALTNQIALSSPLPPHAFGESGALLMPPMPTTGYAYDPTLHAIPALHPSPSATPETQPLTTPTVTISGPVEMDPVALTLAATTAAAMAQFTTLHAPIYPSTPNMTPTFASNISPSPPFHPNISVSHSPVPPHSPLLNTLEENVEGLDGLLQDLLAEAVRVANRHLPPIASPQGLAMLSTFAPAAGTYSAATSPATTPEPAFAPYTTLPAAGSDSDSDDARYRSVGPSPTPLDDLSSSLNSLAVAAAQQQHPHHHQAPSFDTLHLLHHFDPHAPTRTGSTSSSTSTTSSTCSHNHPAGSPCHGPTTSTAAAPSPAPGPSRPYRRRGPRSTTGGYGELAHKTELLADVDPANPLRCRRCGLTFSRPHGLFRHLATAHSAARAHKCERCDARFKRHDSLRKHVMGSCRAGKMVLPSQAPSAAARQRAEQQAVALEGELGQE